MYTGPRGEGIAGFGDFFFIRGRGGLFYGAFRVLVFIFVLVGQFFVGRSLFNGFVEGILRFLAAGYGFIQLHGLGDEGGEPGSEINLPN